MPTARRTLPAPPPAVWAVVSDVRRWPEFFPTVTSVRPVDPAEPTAAGAAYEMKQPRLPLMRWTVTDWRPGTAFTWVSSSLGVRTTGTHWVTASASGGTDVALGIEWTGPLAWLVRAGYGRMTQRYVEAEADALGRLTAG